MYPNADLLREALGVVPRLVHHPFIRRMTLYQAALASLSMARFVYNAHTYHPYA